MHTFCTRGAGRLWVPSVDPHSTQPSAHQHSVDSCESTHSSDPRSHGSQLLAFLISKRSINQSINFLQCHSANVQLQSQPQPNSVPASI